MSQDTIESLRQQLAEVTNEKREYQLEAQGQIEFLDKKLAECQAQEAKLREALDAVQQVANRSEGIAGWHLNGDIASWDSILPEVDEALAISNDATALNELITERTKTQKEYYESVFQDGANRIAELTAEVERLMAEHQAACELVAKMHAAAVGEITGPKRGVVEDVADAIAKLRDELETERMRLAGCGVAALGYFDGCCDTYKSASLDDVLRLRDRNAELTAENRELRMSRSLRQEQHDGEIAELTAQRDVAIGILEHIRRCIPYGGFAQIHDGSATVADIDAAIANCKEPGK